MNQPIIEKNGYIFAFFVFILSLIFIFIYSHEFLSSVVAALLTAGLVWASYIIIRLTILTFKK